METMRPSEVCKQILREHGAVREELDELWAAADLISAGGASASIHALEFSQTLHDEILEHIGVEARILAPALLDADAWGNIHVDLLLRRHAARRVELKTLQGSMTRWKALAFADELRRFITGRRAGMLEHEHELVNVVLLRDDVGGIDVAAG